MEEIEKFLLLMSQFEIPIKKQEILMKNLTNFAIDKVLENSLTRRVLSAKELQLILKNYDPREFESTISNYARSNVKIVTIFSKEYPSKLKSLPERPLLLYAKGDLSLCEEKSIGIVGTRGITNYGRVITQRFTKTLAESGLVIVSGLCYGVDEVAHRTTLEVKGKTIAVIASGFNRIYPAHNTVLAEEIVKNGGLVLSEYPPSFEAKVYTFPRRNRIVAGLSDGVLIPEADFKSGTVYTKDFAIEYGKDIFAIPGNVISCKSNLPNHLIKCGHAECVTMPENILQFYGLEKVAKEKKVVNLSLQQHLIVKLLQDGEKDFDTLVLQSEIEAKTLNGNLTMLEIAGLIKKLPGNLYVLL